MGTWDSTVDASDAAMRSWNEVSETAASTAVAHTWCAVGVRPVRLIITMIKWIQTSRLPKP